MTDAVQVALIVSAGPTIIGAGHLVISILHRKESRGEHLDTKTSIDVYHDEVNGRFQEYLAEVFQKGFAAGAQSKMPGG